MPAQHSICLYCITHVHPLHEMLDMVFLLLSLNMQHGSWGCHRINASGNTSQLEKHDITKDLLDR